MSILLNSLHATVSPNGAPGFPKCPEGTFGHLPENQQIGAMVPREIKNPIPPFEKWGFNDSKHFISSKG
jgi:hypothetical protein